MKPHPDRRQHPQGPICQVRSCVIPAVIVIRVRVAAESWVDTHLCEVHMKKRGIELISAIHDSIHRSFTVDQSNILRVDLKPDEA